jgi:hypothetical protein
MKRRAFIQKTTSAAAGFYILPSGRLFAPTGARVANHVVFCLFAGGIRSLESVHQQRGNLMPNLLAGSAGPDATIAAGLQPLPLLNAVPLENQATYFKEFRYADGIAGHYQGHASAITGKYVGQNVNFSKHSAAPSVFEYYRKHNSPQMAASNAWWISNGLGENENLSWSTDGDYGAQFGGNFLSPAYFLYNPSPILNCRSFSGQQRDQIAVMRNFLNQNFKKPAGDDPVFFQNNEADTASIQAFLQTLTQKAVDGDFNNLWNLGTLINHDMATVGMAEEVIKSFKPELLVVNMTQTDVCHDNFTQYCNNLRKADYAAAHLWQTIQSTPGMKDDTIMIIAPEHGRNETPNSIRDDYGNFSIDHGDDAMSKDIFCMVLGPQNKVYQHQIFNTVKGETIDIVPTIAHILGFWNEIPSGHLTGKPLFEAFK